MAVLGTTVLAINPSKKFIKRVKENTDKIECRVVDAIDKTTMLSLGEKRFDATICTMALMDTSSIEPLLSTLPRLLKAREHSVFSVLHPTFNSVTAHLMTEELYQDVMEEQTFPEDIDISSSSPLNRKNIRSIPPMLVARMRLR